jgi:hypothetical protein
MAKKKAKLSVMSKLALSVSGFVFGPVKNAWNIYFVFKIEDVALRLTELLYWE